MSEKYVDWFLDGALLPLYACAQSTITMEKEWGVNYGFTVIAMHKGKMRFISPRTKVLAMGNLAIDRLATDGSFKNKILSNFKKSIGNLEALFLKIDLGLDEISNIQLKSLFKTFSKYFLEMWEGSIFVDGIPFAGEERLLKALAPNGGRMDSKKAKLLAELLYPSKLTFLGIEDMERKELAGKMSNYVDYEYVKLPKECIALLEAHSKKWFWLENNSLVTKVLDGRYFWGLVREEITNEAREKPNSLKITNTRKKEVISLLSLTQKEYELAMLMDEFAMFQDERKKIWIKSEGYMDFLLIEIAKRTDYSLKALKNAFPWEVEEILDGKKLGNKILEERQDFSFTLYDGKRPVAHIGQVARNKFRQYDSDNEIKLGSFEIHGMCASTGKVIGIAKIITSASDILKIQKGDILIARSTDPEYVVAMKKAAAIVTDEGGITSHAAVVSREMGIPCIVGTRNATKMFKDGELVEVDANHGSVKKMSSSSIG